MLLFLLVLYSSHYVKFTIVMYTLQWFVAYFTMVFNLHHYLIPEHVHYPQNKLHIYNQLVPVVSCSCPLASTELLSVSINLPIRTFHVNEIIRYVAFVCLASFI